MRFFTRKVLFSLKIAFVGSIGGLLFGFDLGVISGALPELKEAFSLTVLEEELVTSLMLIGCIFGSLFGGVICDHIGRKKTIYLVCLLFICGSSALAFAEHTLHLYIGRFIVGIGVAISAIVDVSYLTETSPSEYKGTVVSTNELMITLGLLLAFVIDYQFAMLFSTSGWRYMFIFPSFICVLWMVLMLFCPESPRWAIIHGYRENAFQTYLDSSNTREEAEKEFEEVCEAVQRSLEEANQHRSYSSFLSRYSFPLCLSLSIMLFQNFSGNIAVLSYTPEFLGYAGMSSKAEKGQATILLGTVKVLGTLLSLSLLDRPSVGRRPLLLAGISLMALAHFSMGGLLLSPSLSPSVDDFLPLNLTSSPLYSSPLSHSYLSLSTTASLSTPSSSSPSPSSSSYLLLFFLGLYIFSYSFSFGPVSWLLASELFPDPIRGRAIALASVCNWTGNAMVAASFLSLSQAMGPAGSLFTYGSFCLLSFLFVFSLLPETQGHAEYSGIEAALLASQQRFHQALHRASSLLCCSPPPSLSSLASHPQSISLFKALPSLPPDSLFPSPSSTSTHSLLSGESTSPLHPHLNLDSDHSYQDNIP